MAEHENRTGQQIKTVTEGWTDVVLGMGKAMNRPNTERGLHSSEYFSEPHTDAYGTFDTKWKYTDGCTIDLELDKGVGELVVAVRTDDGQKKVISIGRTPAEWDPKQGSRKIIEGAGDPGDLLTVIVDGVGTEDEKKSYRYLDKEDVAGAVVEHGQGLSLSENVRRQRRVVVSGTVEQAAGLLNQ